LIEPPLTSGVKVVGLTSRTVNLSCTCSHDAVCDDVVLVGARLSCVSLSRCVVRRGHGYSVPALPDMSSSDVISTNTSCTKASLVTTIR